ncbi:MAG: hypothetical protein OSB10_06225 [Planctomycetota bacterium]|nr:hypothetical protein [Planctomycetota bacterium]
MKLFQAVVLSLSCTLGLSSCILLVGAGAGYAVSQELLPSEVQTSLELVDVETAWESAQETMRQRAEDGIQTTDYPRRIECVVAGAEVEVQVEAYDLNRTLIRVRAKRYLLEDDNTARMVMNYILDDLGMAR